MVSIPNFLMEKYEEVELIGEGSYGRVFRCKQNEETSAVKVLIARDDISRKRFKREIEILQRLNNEHIVKIKDSGEEAGQLWYETECANQIDFSKMQGYLFYCNQDRIEYFRQICYGVKALHEADPPIIHRDLKPANILTFEYIGTKVKPILKIADLGSAKLIGEQVDIPIEANVVGTHNYMAPELEKDPEAATPQSDIYSLGIILFEFFINKTEVTSENINQVSDDVRPIIEKMVHHASCDRYQSIDEVLKAISKLSTHRLIFGFEPELGSTQVQWQANDARELDNALEFLDKANKENISARYTAYKSKLDIFSEAHDEVAWSISVIRGEIVAMIENARQADAEDLVRRFLKAIKTISDTDLFAPTPYMIVKFLSDTFDVASYRLIKDLCLEGLVYCLTRYDIPLIKCCLYKTIRKIKDPDYYKDLAEHFRRAGRQDIASLFDEIFDPVEVNWNAIRKALRGTE